MIASQLDPLLKHPRESFAASSTDRVRWPLLCGAIEKTALRK